MLFRFKCFLGFKKDFLHFYFKGALCFQGIANDRTLYCKETKAIFYTFVSNINPVIPFNLSQNNQTAWRQIL